ncbi:palmitoyl-CoA hydrolase [Sporothrix schenckii 1099-18]|uniref:Acyl-CoA thioesterase II n=3 Tax=Sporothrix TaxID=29907 RepID=U7PPF5_SPOS1|nr:palmitoyl-CoA hydrolase [Sporothrix schenckii 1099-18]XP_040617248.1 palmitoyl-CoA hydrolase [Sporothrix brasiliensis 5110]ERS96624.1 acyl-CoA thioesterase II [Sporothrix schenckii ATCC 58251]KIH89238.1 palmitoyl-CoA hydrolase [Sporothrix brasiliensis 5110]KJR81310.1 palmitoyl-CoA hydrolase [Sporothrix schenckii 1099-18]
MPQSHPTILRPPPPNPALSALENDLDVTALGVLGEDIFTNTRPPWHPPGARGIYGGSVVGMCLAAGQRTVSPEFALHSCHCYFLLAGNADVPILFHVERVRDGRSFVTRTVQARQRGRCIFTVTMSFTVLPNTSTAATATASLTPPPSRGLPARIAGVGHHAAALPDVRPPVPPPGYEEHDAVDSVYIRLGRAFGSPKSAVQPILSGPMMITGSDDAPHLKQTMHWVRVRGSISKEGGRAAHLNALSYVTDNYFIGTITRIHRMWRFPIPVAGLLGHDGDNMFAPEQVQAMRDLVAFETGGATLESFLGQPEVGMVVSLDHTIYFHEPDLVRADEWMLAVMDSPWAGEGRGVVTQRIFSKDGTLLVTCIQEGIMRLKDDEHKGTPKARI